MGKLVQLGRVTRETKGAYYNVVSRNVGGDGDVKCWDNLAMKNINNCYDSSTYSSRYEAPH